SLSLSTTIGVRGRRRQGNGSLCQAAFDVSAWGKRADKGGRGVRSQNTVGRLKPDWARSVQPEGPKRSRAIFHPTERFNKHIHLQASEYVLLCVAQGQAPPRTQSFQATALLVAGG